MVIANVQHQGEEQADRRQGVGAGHRNVGPRCAVGHQADRQPHRVRRERHAARGSERQPILARGLRNEAAAEAPCRDGEPRGAAARGPRGAGERRGGLAARLEPGTGREQERIASRGHRLRLEVEIAGIVCGDAQRAQEHRKPDVDHDRVRRPSAARESREQVALQRPGGHPGTAQRVQADAARSPALPGRAQPEGGVPPAKGVQLERGAVAAVEEGADRSDPHGRHGGLPGAARVPKRRGGAVHGPGGTERGEAERQDDQPGKPQCADRLGERLGGCSAAAHHVVRLHPVGEREERVAGARCRPVQEGSQRAVAPGTELLEPPGDAPGREPRLRTPRQVGDPSERDHSRGPCEEHPVRRLEPAEPHDPRRQTQQQSAGTERDCGPAERRPQP